MSGHGAGIDFIVLTEDQYGAKAETMDGQTEYSLPGSNETFDTEFQLREAIAQRERAKVKPYSVGKKGREAIEATGKKGGAG